MGTPGCELVRTRGGDAAIRDLASGQVMHPMGPAVEAQQVYVGPSRLEGRLREGGAPLVLFDIGLGAGTNAMAAWRLSESLPPTARRLRVVSFERDLSAFTLALAPENAEAFGFSTTGALAAAASLAEKGAHETPRTAWTLRFGDFLRTLEQEPAASADVVFWDMFSASVNPELWSVSSFRALRRACRDGATLHTYSASTSTRAALLLAGFAVGVGDRTGDRQETTVAALRSSDLAQPLDARWLHRLARSTAPFPIDVPDDAGAHEEARARIREQPQFHGVPPTR